MQKAPDPHCRIGKVRHKNAPHLAELYPPRRGLSWEKDVHKWVEDIFESYKDVGIAGITVIALGFDGYYSRGVRIHKDSYFGRTLFPELVASTLRRDTMIEVAHNVLNDDE